MFSSPVCIRWTLGPRRAVFPAAAPQRLITHPSMLAPEPATARASLRSSSRFSGCQPAIKEGWLSKKGGMRQNWRARYFELWPDRLAYSEAKDGRLCGEVSLAQCSAVRLSTAPHRHAVRPQLQTVDPSRLRLIVVVVTCWLARGARARGRCGGAYVPHPGAG